MMDHKICFKGVIWKIFPLLSLLPFLTWSTGQSNMSHKGEGEHCGFGMAWDVWIPVGADVYLFLIWHHYYLKSYCPQVLRLWSFYQGHKKLLV